MICNRLFVADYSALATIPLVQGRVFYAPQVNAIILMSCSNSKRCNVDVYLFFEGSVFYSLLALKVLCTVHIQRFQANLIFVSGAFGQTHWRGRSRFPSNPPLFPPRPTNPEQPNCDQGEKKTSNSCHRCHFPNFLYHCSSLGYPNSAQALCLDARKSSEIFLRS